MAVIRAMRERVADQLLAIPGVIDVGVGWKVVGNVVTTQRAIIVRVYEKRPRHSIEPEHSIPAEIDGVPTDVIEIGGGSRRVRRRG
jgi:hypothetical protein